MQAINSFWPESRIDSVLVMRPQISFALLNRSGKAETRSKTQAHQSVATAIVYCRCWPLPFCKYIGGRNHAFAISNICWTLILCRLHTLNFAGRRWSRNHAFGPHFRISAPQDVHWFNEAWPRALANQLQTAQCHRPIPARSFKCIGYLETARVQKASTSWLWALDWSFCDGAPPEVFVCFLLFWSCIPSFSSFLRNLLFILHIDLCQRHL